MYADLDFDSLKDSTKLLQGQEVLLGALVPHEHAQMLPNAWLASAHAGHPFWLFCVKEIVERATACAPTLLLNGPRLTPDASESCSNALHPHSVACCSAQANKPPMWDSTVTIPEHCVSSSVHSRELTAALHPTKLMVAWYCSLDFQSTALLCSVGDTC